MSSMHVRFRHITRPRRIDTSDTTTRLPRCRRIHRRAPKPPPIYECSITDQLRSLVAIDGGTFYRHHPSTVQDIESNPPLFPNLRFWLPHRPKQRWAILSSSSSARTAFLRVLRGEYLCFPPTAQSYPVLADVAASNGGSGRGSPAQAIQYVGFDFERGGKNTFGAYLSARYEARREELDFSLIDYLRGNTELNAAEDVLDSAATPERLRQCMKDLDLEKLRDMPVGNLSNGQMRRARIAKALISNPELLLLDGPFMGLDPQTREKLSSLLHQLSMEPRPQFVLSLGPDDSIPKWISHLAFLDDGFTVSALGERKGVLQYISDAWTRARMVSCNEISIAAENDGRDSSFSASMFNIGQDLHDKGHLPPTSHSHVGLTHRERDIKLNPSKFKAAAEDDSPPNPFSSSPAEPCAPIVEMNGVQIRYGTTCVLGDFQQPDFATPGLHWTVRAGERWGVFGPNGSGKTTLLALLTSDHPQSYSAPLKLFGRARLPQPGKPGLSLWDINARVGHSSPEVHAFFPRNIPLRRALESAWADTPFAPLRLTAEIDAKVESTLRWFQAELMPALGPTPPQRAELLRTVNIHMYDGALGGKFQREKTLLRTHFNEYKWHLDVGLEWADETLFGELSFSSQRLLLFLRAVISGKELIVLDEAFSGMDDYARQKCMVFLQWGEEKLSVQIQRDLPQLYVGTSVLPALQGPAVVNSDVAYFDMVKVRGLRSDQALVVVSHSVKGVPDYVSKWMCLPEPGGGTAVRMGTLEGPLGEDPKRWREIWGMSK